MRKWIRPAGVAATLGATLASLGVTADAQLPQREPNMFYAPPPPFPPGPDTVPFRTTRLLDRPGPSLRHAVAASLGRIPAEGIPLSIRCDVNRVTGRIPYCESPRVENPFGSGIYRLALACRFDLDDNARLHVGSLTTTVEDRIVRADLRDTGFVQRRLTDRAQLVLAREPSPAEMATMFVPVSADMRMTCEIQADLSLFCVDPQPVGRRVDPPTLGFLQDAAFDAVSLMRAAPRLRNGRNARGAVVSLDIRLVGSLASPL